MMPPDVEMRLALMSGGHFYATWPSAISGESLAMVDRIFGLTMEVWIDAKGRSADAEIEYASWLQPSA